jgi:hypothetical protein
MTDKLTNTEDIIFRRLCNLINSIAQYDSAGEVISAVKIAKAIGVWGGLKDDDL